MFVCVAAFVAAFSLCGGSALAQQVTKENVPRGRNLAQLETTVACAGAITPRIGGRGEEDGVSVDRQPASRLRRRRQH